ncbi:MAG: O-antigen ligase family protein [Limnothrix sp.]
MDQSKLNSLAGYGLLLAGIPLMMGVSLVGIREPLYLVAAAIAAGCCYAFFKYFETTVIALLVVRSALDVFSDQQLPAALALGIDALVMIYVAHRLITRQTIETDRFWWFLIGWFVVQGLWVVLLPLGGLGAGTSVLGDAVREWVRLISGGLIYLLVMQLKGRIAPEQLVNLLFLCVAIPIAFGILQCLPIDGLPTIIVPEVSPVAIEEGSRVQGSMGHPNSFACFALLFVALSLWKGEHAERPIRWFALAGLLIFLLLASKSITGIVMLGAFIVAYFLPKLRGKDIFWALGLTAVITVLLMANSSGGRLGELAATPLLNRDLDVSRAIALQAADVDAYRNSFNWRLAHWSNLIQQWRLHPWMGYGMASAKKISLYDNTPHNDYVRFLTEGGIVGFMTFVLFHIAQLGRLVQLTRTSYPKSPQQRLGMTLIAVHISMMVGMLAGNVLTGTTLFFYWWTLLAVLGWQWQSPSVLTTSHSAFSRL